MMEIVSVSETSVDHKMKWKSFGEDFIDRFFSPLHIQGTYNEVKQPLHRVEQSLMSSGGIGFKISRHSAHEGGQVLSLKHRPSLLSRDNPLLISVKKYRRLQGQSGAGRIKSMKYPNGFTENRPHRPAGLQRSASTNCVTAMIQRKGAKMLTVLRYMHCNLRLMYSYNFQGFFCLPIKKLDLWYNF
jgi:hypothetical protein